MDGNVMENGKSSRVSDGMRNEESAIKYDGNRRAL